MTIVRRKTPHAILLALAVKDMTPEEVRKMGALFSNPHCAAVALERLRERGLVEVKARITARGRAYLKRIAA